MSDPLLLLIKAFLIFVLYRSFNSDFDFSKTGIAFFIFFSLFFSIYISAFNFITNSFNSVSSNLSHKLPIFIITLSSDNALSNTKLILETLHDSKSNNLLILSFKYFIWLIIFFLYLPTKFVYKKIIIK